MSSSAREPSPSSRDHDFKAAEQRLAKRAAEILALGEKYPAWAIGEAKQHAEDIARLLADNERLREASEAPSMTYEAAEKLALRAIHDTDGRGMVGAGRNHLHQRVARAILSALMGEG